MAQNAEAAILCHDNEHWTEHLSMILLGLRSIYKEDIKVLPASPWHNTQNPFGAVHYPRKFFI